MAKSGFLQKQQAMNQGFLDVGMDTGFELGIRRPVEVVR